MRTMVPAIAIAKEVPLVAAKESAQASSPQKCAEQHQPRSLADGILSLRGAGDASLCDVLLVVGDEVFPAHQAMLSAMSPAFGVFLREAKPEPQASPAGPAESSNAPAKDGGSASESLAEPVVEAPTADAAIPQPSESAPSTSGAEKQVSYEDIARAALKRRESGAEDKPSSSDVATVDDAMGVAATTETQVAVEQHLKLRVQGVSLAESVKIMLDYIYQVGTGGAWEYSPSSMEVNKEVLQLARQFELKHLHEHAARYLTRGLTTKNLVERLVICEEFKLGLLREKLIEQLTANPTELSLVCRSAEVLAHPTILQDLLVQVYKLCEMAQERPGSPQKRQATEVEKAEEKAVEEEKEKVEKAAEKEKEKEKVDKAAEKENQRLERAAEKEKIEKAAEKALAKAEKDDKHLERSKSSVEKHVEEEKPEKSRPEKVSLKPSVKVPPLKKKRVA